jgi:hypothetical protein
VISDGRTTHSDLSLPSGAGLRDMVCPGVSLGPEKGVIAGRVVDADTDVPIAGAKVLVVWTEITIDRKARKIKRDDCEVIEPGRKEIHADCADKGNTRRHGEAEPA